MYDSIEVCYIYILKLYALLMSHLDIEKYKNGHAFANTYPKEMLSFLWSSLGYGEINEPGNWKDEPSPGTYTTFDQKEFYPEITDWQGNKQFKGREKVRRHPQSVSTKRLPQTPCDVRP